MELLVTIVIIAILMGMLLPAISSMMEKAKRTKAMAEIKALETALKMYETTYGYLPWSGNNDVELTSTQYKVLIGYLQNSDKDSDSDGEPDDNPRGIRMLEVDNEQGIGVYDDPWKDKKQPKSASSSDKNARYRVKFDTDYDGEITDIDQNEDGTDEVSSSTTPSAIYASVVIWSRGKVVGGSTSKDLKDDVLSWKK